MILILSVCLLLCCGWDYYRRRIPNRLVVVCMAVILLFCLQRGGWSAVLGSIGKTGKVFLIFYPLFRRNMLGAGDVKLLAVCSGLLSGKQILLFLFFSFFFGAIASIIHFLFEKDFMERMEYLASYMMQVVQTGKWSLYFERDSCKQKASVCMAGPVLLSLLLVWEGVF